MKKYLALILFALPAWPIQITAPEGWQQQYNLPAGIVGQYVSPNRTGNFSPNLNLVQKLEEDSALASIKTPAALGDYMEKTQARMFPLFKVIEKKPRNVGTVQGVLLVATYAYGNLDLAAFQYAYRPGKGLATVVFTCLKRDLNAMRPVFEKSLASLKVEDSVAGGGAPKP